MKKLIAFVLGLFVTLPAISAGLPSGYTELQWIEKKQGATGYIDTNVPQGDNVGIKVNVKFSTYVSGYQYVAGAFTQGSYIGIWKDSADVIKFCHVNTIRSVSNTNTTDFQVIENNYLNSRKYRINGTDEGNIAETTSVTSPTIYIFNTHYGTMFNGGFLLAGAEITVGGEVVRNFVPVKRDSDNRLGMYDTVNDKFYAITDYENFVAGDPVAQTNTCNNLFDGQMTIGTIGSSDGRLYTSNTQRLTSTNFTDISPNTTYVLSGLLKNISPVKMIYFYQSDGTYISYVQQGNNFTTPANAAKVKFTIYSSSITEVVPSDATQMKLEQGETATTYCRKLGPIKIATTKYNTNAFSGVVTALNTAVATIKDVVANTINQATAVANLQFGKQQRPDESCPAGKTCLLVEDMNGDPHWYEIVESYVAPTTSRLPSGYTELAYIESTGTQYIDTGTQFNANTNVEIDFQYTNVGGSYNDLFGVTFPSRVDKSYLLRTNSNGYTVMVGKDVVIDAERLDRHTYKVENLNMYLDGVLKGTGISMESNPINAYLFASQNENKVFGQSKAKVYYFKIWNGSTLVRDFVPAQHGSDVGMYDLVNDRFYTDANGGNFTAGPAAQ